MIVNIIALAEGTSPFLTENRRFLPILLRYRRAALVAAGDCSRLI